MKIPTRKEIEEGYKAFEKYEPREAMYKIATYAVKHFWGDAPKMADGLGTLLLTWNHAFYRYGSFDFDLLEKCIKNNLKKLKVYREKKIYREKNFDENEIVQLFDAFNKALAIKSGKMGKTKSPVATAKALHLLAPNFFPLWDYKISCAYKCRYAKNPAQQYIKFMKIMRHILIELNFELEITKHKTALKLIDEYNYAKYTKHLI